ncbi:MAG: imidazole glycerol phosphate synthase cyclase subunit [bacterium]|nr:imidazole glycerol phosphate synthase cyclase subunit [bacterium]
MRNIRIISRLDIKGPNVVKGVFTEGLRVVGNPKELVNRYYKDGADELLYMDIVASLYQRNIDFNLLKSVVEGIFIPVTVGGGIRSLGDIDNALRAGADKVAVNTFAINNPKFISEAVRRFGSQCIVLSVEAKKTGPNKWEAYTDGGREKTGKDAIGWVKKAIELGVGEVIITSIDRDGSGRGYDAELNSKVMSFANIPVIVHGGASSPASFKDILDMCHPDALSAASVFHYQSHSIHEVKKFLKKNNFQVRI